jgi:CubicO group peptidase (beta-lactamase class C family)
VVVSPEKQLTVVSKGECSWGGMASTAFTIDPAEQMAVVLMAQLVPSATYNIRRELRVLVYQALVEPTALAG